ncbi:MAG: efflux RND transporter periplasmic adaptor subunit [Rhodospirillales bacterium]|nr:efflux RND transporter periplasmic adaptor subunit [Rhodospirillales bacterium]
MVKRSPTKLKRRLKAPVWVFLGSFVALAVALGVFVIPTSQADGKKVAQNQAPGEPPAQVGVNQVIQEPLKQTVPVIGRFVARQTGVVAARTNGPVGEVLVEVGDRVKTGDVIAVLVNDLLKWRHELQKAEVEQYAAAVKTQKAMTKLRRQELERIQRLIKSAAFSQARLDDKRQEVAVAYSQAAEAVARLASAKANMNLTKTNLSYTVVTAPYSGVVSKRHIEVGAYVNTGEAVVTLVNDTHLEIEADVPAGRTAGLLAGLQVPAVLDNGTRITARVRAVVPEEKTQTRTLTVRFVPELPKGLSGIASNQSVSLSLPAGRNGIVVTVHKDAILSRKGNTLVYVAQDGKAMIRPVRLGEAVGTRFIVKAGLVPGDLVVVRGNERLVPGQNILFQAPPDSLRDSSAGSGKVKG